MSQKLNQADLPVVKGRKKRVIPNMDLIMETEFFNAQGERILHFPAKERQPSRNQKSIIIENQLYRIEWLPTLVKGDDPPKT